MINNKDIEPNCMPYIILKTLWSDVENKIYIILHYIKLNYFILFYFLPAYEETETQKG